MLVGMMFSGVVSATRSKLQQVVGFPETRGSVEEKFLSLDLISSARVRRFIHYLLNLREVEGQEEVLETKDKEEEESEVDEKVKDVRENAQLMHATW